MEQSKEEKKCCEKCGCEGFSCAAGLGHKSHCKAPSCPCHKEEKKCCEKCIGLIVTGPSTTGGHFCTCHKEERKITAGLNHQSGDANGSSAILASNSIETITLNNVDVQANGIIRNSKGRLIGRLVDDVEFESEHIKGLIKRQTPQHHKETCPVNNIPQGTSGKTLENWLNACTCSQLNNWEDELFALSEKYCKHDDGDLNSCLFYAFKPLLKKSYEQGKQETCMAYDETYWTSVIGKNRREAKQEERNRIIGLIDEIFGEYAIANINSKHLVTELKSKINQPLRINCPDDCDCGLIIDEEYLLSETKEINKILLKLKSKINQ